eukprot:134394-Rhodomonas_salina.1
MPLDYKKPTSVRSPPPTPRISLHCSPAHSRRSTLPPPSVPSRNGQPCPCRSEKVATCRRVKVWGRRKKGWDERCQEDHGQDQQYASRSPPADNRFVFVSLRTALPRSPCGAPFGTVCACFLGSESSPGTLSRESEHLWAGPHFFTSAARAVRRRNPKLEHDVGVLLDENLKTAESES